MNVKTHDEFPAVEYTGYELAPEDTVWVAIPGLDHLGFWAEVQSDDGTDKYVPVRVWGYTETTNVARVNIKYEQTHSCECGRDGIPTSARLCHPDA